MNPIDFHPDAAQEANDALDDYDGLRPGLGDDFRVELDDALARIQQNPTLYAVESGSVRVCSLHRFSRRPRQQHRQRQVQREQVNGVRSACRGQGRRIKMRTSVIIVTGLLISTFGAAVLWVGLNAQFARSLAIKSDDKPLAESQDLRAIYELYALYQRNNGRPPKEQSDLESIAEMSHQGIVALTTRRYVVRWGLPVVNSHTMHSAVLAYPTDIKANGGSVLYCSGLVVTANPPVIDQLISHTK